jgi:hypothetical protein
VVAGFQVSINGRFWVSTEGPVVRDSDSSHVDVTIIKVGTPEEHLGTVEARVGEVAVESKTTPAFKIAIVKVTPPEEG